MFVKISDFNNTTFNDLWGGFSCDCVVDETNKIISFYRDGEAFSLSGNEVEDILDFVLSEYYENENTLIEDGFSNWLKKHHNIPTLSSGHTEEEKPTEEDNLETLYNVVMKEWNRQNKIIKNQKNQIKRLKQKLDKSSSTNFILRKELETLKKQLL